METQGLKPTQHKKKSLLIRQQNMCTHQEQWMTVAMWIEFKLKKTLYLCTLLFLTDSRTKEVDTYSTMFGVTSEWGIEGMSIRIIPTTMNYHPSSPEWHFMWDRNPRIIIVVLWLLRYSGASGPTPCRWRTKWTDSTSTSWRYWPCDRH